MQYCAPGDVSALFKNFSSFTTLTSTIVQQAISDVQVEIDNVLRNLYRVPLAFNTAQYLYQTTLTGSVAANATSGVLTAAGSNAAPIDSLPFWFQPGDSIYLDPGTGFFERQVLATVNPTSGAFTVAQPIGQSPISYTGFQNAHADKSVVIASKSLDLIFLITTRLSFANLVDVYYASSSPKGVNEQAATARHYGEALLADVVSGNTAFTDLVTAGERPMYPAASGATIGNPAWTGTIGDPGTPDFQKELGIQYINGQWT